MGTHTNGAHKNKNHKNPSPIFIGRHEATGKTRMPHEEVKESNDKE
jgi:hypothetical protein